MPPAHVTYDTLDEARRVATAQAARLAPCELVVRDAYHRVLRREVLGATLAEARTVLSDPVG
jgi:hypothetical protein